ncbi:2-hydroxy-palmitic acid dioxygenase MPO1 [Sporobolomyces koalae]|uniref:2-hydroxy-palmitic acid dioxygenase MPO1 n=1 Tax=Sporobolomyces koalae TaxID=500713 RepID=UPI00316F12A7
MPNLLDFERQFTFYASYHTNSTNVLIHIFCVPTILFTALVLTHGIPGAATSFASLPLGSTKIDLTFPFLYAAANATYFILLEPLAGLLYAPMLLSFGHLSNVLYSTHHDQAMKYAAFGFVASWIAQFIGHGKFEGRAPALLDSLLQSLVLAVFFVWLEVLFFLGYRPALFKRLQNKTGVEVTKYRREKALQEAKKLK